MKQYNFSIVIEHDKDGFFIRCPELQGCYTQGNTYEEAIDNIKDVIKLCVEDMRENDEEIVLPDSISLSTIAITI